MKKLILVLAILLMAAGSGFCEEPALEKSNIEELKALAHLGDSEAQFNLGLCYYNGDKVLQGVATICELSHEQAFYWWQKSAKQGNAMAQYFLSDLYYKGEGVSVDYVQAYKWCHLSNRLEVAIGSLAAHLLQQIGSKMTEDQIAEAQALADAWLKEHQAKQIAN